MDGVKQDQEQVWVVVLMTLEGLEPLGEQMAG
jgi:hypothetical protein